MNANQETENADRLPTDDADGVDAAFADEAVANGAGDERNGATEKAPRKRSRPDFGCLAGMAVLLAVVLFFGWMIVSAIADVIKEDRQAELRRWQAFETYRDSVSRRSSSGGSSYGNSSSGGSSSYPSSGGAYKPKKKEDSDRKDEYNAADFGNPEDFYDEHYDDFFDYYDAEDYWNEHN